jgi:hypothetical protein
VAPGEDAANPLPGDFILTHAKGWQSSLIRFGQRLRFRGENRRFAYWSHAAMIVSDEGDLVEAEMPRVIKRNISVYHDVEYHLIRIGLSADHEDRKQAARFALKCVDQRYDFAAAVSIGISLLFGGQISFGFEAHKICSGLVARALERSWAIFDREPSHILPADLARHYAVEPYKVAQPATDRGMRSVLDQEAGHAADDDDAHADAPEPRR